MTDPGESTGAAASRLGRRAVQGAVALLVLTALVPSALYVLRPRLGPARRPNLAESLAAVSSMRGVARTGAGRVRVAHGAEGLVDFLWSGERPVVEAQERLMLAAEDDVRTLVKVVGAPPPLDGAFRWEVDVEELRRDSKTLDGFRRTVLGGTGHAEATLMLLGEDGRHAAVSVLDDDSPPRFEWAFGPERGAVELRTDLPRRSPRQVSLGLDSAGALTARVGDAVVGEPLPLGPDWRDAFGGRAWPALLCLGGWCRFGAMALTSGAASPDAGSVTK